MKRWSRDQMLRRSHVSAAGERRQRESQPSFGGEKSLPHARQDRLASSVSRPLEGRQRRKSPVRRCFKSRPPFGGVRRFASGCRSCRRAVDWPLVQIPADRHTTTGTCVLGKTLFVRIIPERKRFFASAAVFSCRHKKFTSGRRRTVEIAVSACRADGSAGSAAKAAPRPRRSNRSAMQSLSELLSTILADACYEWRHIKEYHVNFL